MAFNEEQTCMNCLFRLVLGDQISRCRFNAPSPSLYGKNMPDMSIYNEIRYPTIPGPACGQWQTDFEEPEIIIEPEDVLPRRIDK